MPIIGFNFDKILVERTNKVGEKVEIKNDLGIKELEVEKLELSDLSEALKFIYEFTLTYSPDIGNISIKGHILYTDEPKKLKELQKDWKKDKKIPTEILEMLLNNILYRCHIKSLSLAQEVNLPPHINMPAIKSTNQQKNYIG